MCTRGQVLGLEDPRGQNDVALAIKSLALAVKSLALAIKSLALTIKSLITTLQKGWKDKCRRIKKMKGCRKGSVEMGLRGNWNVGGYRRTGCSIHT